MIPADMEPETGSTRTTGECYKDTGNDERSGL